MKEEIETFQKRLEATRDEIMSLPNSQPPSMLESIPEQIKKLAELKNLGIISEDEFNSKKIQLLDKM